MYFQIASIETTAKEINVRANGTSLRKFPNNTTVVNLSPVQTRPEKFENATLFLRLGLLSTLTCPGAFQERSANRGRNLETRALRFRVDGNIL